jgi:uncharacterized protein (DUF1800 family)
MDRRSFLKGGKSNNELVSIERERNGLPARTTSGIQPYTGSWATKEVIHLLKRTMFGARPADIQYFLGKTMSQAVDELLNPTASLPSPPLKDYDITNATTPDNDVAFGTTWVNSINNDGTIQSRRLASLKKWWTGNLLNQDRSIREKMTIFWHHFFSTEMVEVSNGNFYYKYITLLRNRSLGNAKQFVYDITLDPAMLIYLNGRLNRDAAPDENYARELQELFTLGKENNPNYTEADVIAAAKVLTGWRVNSNDASFPSYFTESRHDTTNKQFSSFYNNTVITGRTGATGGAQEINDLINMIFSKSTEVSRHIVKRLYRFFVYSEIDTTAMQNVIEPLALTLRTNNWEIKPVLSQLFKSEHFYDVLNRGAQIKSPLDHVITLCREWNVVFPPTTDVVNSYSFWNFTWSVAAALQQNLGDPPSVAGWPAYYQIPQYYELWVNADTLPKRNQLSDVLVTSGYTANNFKLIIDVVGYTASLSNPSDPNALINEVTDRMLMIPLSENIKTQLKRDFLLTGQDQDYYWSTAWQTYVGNPTTMNYNIVLVRLAGLYKYLMNLAEYQLT